MPYFESSYKYILALIFQERIISSGTDTDKNTKDLEELISSELVSLFLFSEV
jgi:hypothetical protein